MITVEVHDQEVRAVLQQLAARVGNLRPVMQAIGDDVMERAKTRFGTSTGPDGRRWQANARATIEAWLDARSGTFARYSNLKTRKEGASRVGNKKGFYDKGGRLASKGIDAVLSKKPLVDTHDLSRQFHVSATATGVTVGNSMIYAAIHQFGGQAGKGKKVTIPARPFLPITQRGDLYPAERAQILDQINDYLAGK